MVTGSPGTPVWRLWHTAVALSRKSYPKQFVSSTGEESLYQASARRLSGIEVCRTDDRDGADFRFIVVEQLAALEIIPPIS